MTEYEFINSIGHQHVETAEGPRHLVQGPIVPDGEIWHLRLIAAKNNMDINAYPDNRTTAELSVCVWLPPRPSEHEQPPPGTWALLNGSISVPQFLPIKWEGYLTLRPGSQLGAWFRGAMEGDALELDAIYDIEREVVWCRT